MKLPFVKTEQQVIEAIHHEFDSAQDRLLKEAQDILSNSVPLPTFEERVIEQAERLKKLGFVNAQMAKHGEELMAKKRMAVQQVVSTKEEADLILYYKHTYPFLKFLTEKELDRICAKYKLIHAPVANYIGQVPEKNLKDIENAQTLRVEDETKKINLLVINTWWNSVPNDLKKCLEKKIDFKTKYETSSIREDDVMQHAKKCGYTGNHKGYIFKDAVIRTEDKSGLFIAAPEKEFNLEGLKKTKSGWKKVFEVEVHDPIVFRYVRGGIQVLTKWGLEASDPALLLPQDN